MSYWLSLACLTKIKLGHAYELQIDYLYFLGTILIRQLESKCETTEVLSPMLLFHNLMKQFLI